MQKKRSLGLCRFQKFQEASLLSSAELQSGVMQHCNIAHSFQRCSVLVGPDLRAGRFMACTVTLLGRARSSALTTFPCTYALAKHTHEMAFRNRL